MSPEQARGEDLDARTDLFSFGAVLYEMATGKPAFTGATTAMIHEAILGRTPSPASTVNARIPRDLDGIVGKALEKDRDLRYQHAADMRADLKRLKRDTDSSRHASAASSAETQTVRKPGGRAWKLAYGFAAAIALLALGLGLAWFKSKKLATSRVFSERQLTRNTPENRALGGAISPDGKHLVYTDTKGLHLSVIETGEVHDIPLPEELRAHLWSIAWFPDGEKLLLTVYNGPGDDAIWVTSIFGGVPRKLRTGGCSAAISPQGTSIAFIGGQGREICHEIWLMGANGENPRKVFTSAFPNGQLAVLAWSPTGQRLAYVKIKRGSVGSEFGSDFGGSIETVAPGGGSPSLVTSSPALDSDIDSAPLLWARDGRLIFALTERRGDSDNLWGIVTDPNTGSAAGKPVRMTNWSGVSVDFPRVTYDGSRLTVFKTHNRDDVYVAELKAKSTRLGLPMRLTMSDSLDYPDAWTRDSSAVLFESNRTERIQIFRQQLRQDTAEPLTQGPDDEQGAESSPDGAWILYWATANGGKSPAASRRRCDCPIPVGLLCRFSMPPSRRHRVSSVPLTLVVCASSAAKNKVIGSLHTGSGPWPG